MDPTRDQTRACCADLTLEDDDVSGASAAARQSPIPILSGRLRRRQINRIAAVRRAELSRPLGPHRSRRGTRGGYLGSCGSLTCYSSSFLLN